MTQRLQNRGAEQEANVGGNDEIFAASRKRKDYEIKSEVMSESFMDMDFKCKKSCNYSGQCRNNPGFWDYVRKSREDFWGKSGAPVIPSSQRRKFLEAEMKKGDKRAFASF